MAGRPCALSLPYDSRALSAKSAAMSVHSPNCEYCAYASCTRLTARTDSARSTFCASWWTRAAALRFGLVSAVTTTWSAPNAASIASAHTARGAAPAAVGATRSFHHGVLEARRRTWDGLVMAATQESFPVGIEGKTILQRCAPACQSVTASWSANHGVFPQTGLLPTSLTDAWCRVAERLR